jgi:signal transduction histidine kinase
MTVTRSQDPQELLRMSIGPACHELRSPLAVVYGFARMLETGADQDPTTAKYVAQIVRGAERLDFLLDDLAKLGRIASGRLNPQLESVALKEIVDKLQAMSVNEGRIKVEPGTDVHVKVDPSWLGDSLQAIIDGLCFEDGIDIQVSWRHEQHDVVLQLVPNSSFPMIDVEPEKSGLGIALARVRVIAMGGTFDGSGDRITVTFPHA